MDNVTVRNVRDRFKRMPLPDVEAEITLSLAANPTGVWSGFRAALHYDGSAGDAMFWFEGDNLLPGSSAHAKLWLLDPSAHRGHLRPGKSFDLREGSKTIGHGIVTRLVLLPEE